MNKLIYILFISIFVVEWNIGFPRLVELIPELILIFVAVIVIFQFATRKPFALQGKYLLFFIFTVLLILIGIIVNQVQPGIIFNGVRHFMKYLPIFLLPMVYKFSEKEIMNQLKLLLFLLLLQIPIVIYQRFINFRHHDFVSGTVGNTKTLSGLLIWAIAVLFAFYFKGKMRGKHVVMLSILFLVPLVLTETAGSLFLLPLAILIPMLFADLGQNKRTYLLTTLFSGSLFFVIFIAGYNYFYGDRWGEGGILALVTEGKVIEVEADADKRQRDKIGAGRLASIENAVEILWKLDKVKFIVGVGIGNATDSFTENLRGKYYEKYLKDGITKHTFSTFLWSFGLIGIVLFYIFLYLLFKDARALSPSSEIIGVLSLGWIGCLAIFAVQSIYINVTQPYALGCLFAYISGLIAAQRIWLSTNYRY